MQSLMASDGLSNLNDPRWSGTEVKAEPALGPIEELVVVGAIVVVAMVAVYSNSEASEKTWKIEIKPSSAAATESKDDDSANETEELDTPTDITQPEASADESDKDNADDVKAEEESVDDADADSAASDDSDE